MKFLPLLWCGIWRKPVRTALIFLQVCVAFALFGVLQGMKTGMDRAIANTPADVLYVGPAVYGGAPLSIGALSRLQSVPGVKATSFNYGMLTFYQKPSQSVYVLAIPPSDLFLTLLPQIFPVQPKELEALRKTRTGVLITPDIAKKYGWHIGDKIPLCIDHASDQRLAHLDVRYRGDGHPAQQGRGDLRVRQLLLHR